MGNYSRNYTWRQMVNMGFIKSSDVDAIYKGVFTHPVSSKYTPFKFYFRYFDINQPYGTAYLNIGDTGLAKEGIKIFKKGSAQYNKALKLRYT